MMVKTFFYQPIRYNLITFENIWKITTCQGDVHITGCFLDYNYFSKCYKMITIFFIIEKTEETVLDFSQGNVKAF